jgi:hypothetical protein
MRRVLVLAVLALALPIGAWADVLATNGTGTLAITDLGVGYLGTIGSTTISTANAVLTSWNAHIANPGTAIGKVAFSTGTLQSGSVYNGGIFNAGGSFDIVGSGKWAHNLTHQFCGTGCTLFTGSFSSTVTWTFTGVSGVAGKTRDYTLSGSLSGVNWLGNTTTGLTTQNISITPTNFMLSKGHINMGSESFSTPEPGTFGLLGTGLIGIAGMFRRKLMGWFT